MKKIIRNWIVFALIVLCLFTTSMPIFAEAGISEITNEEWKELEEKLWSSPMGIFMIILSPIIILFAIVILIVKLCVEFFNSACIIMGGFGVVDIIFKFLI